jgi:hypothetical protein
MSSTVKSFVLRKLNRTKAAFLLAQARHANAIQRAMAGMGLDGTVQCSVCGAQGPKGRECPTISSLRADVAAGEVALAQAIREERESFSSPARGAR